MNDTAGKRLPQGDYRGHPIMGGPFLIAHCIDRQRLTKYACQHHIYSSSVTKEEMNKLSKKSELILVGVILLMFALALLVPILYHFPQHPSDWTIGKMLMIVIGMIALVIGIAVFIRGWQQH
jgi:hypothetical protein